MTFKKINPKETVFYVFETSTIKFSIFDSEMDEAIYWGNWNMVMSLIKNIKKQNMRTFTINELTLLNKHVWLMFRLLPH